MQALQSLPIPLQTVLLLTLSNVFMTFAWYGHLKYKHSPLFLAILVSWGIAFFEYLLMVPANRMGSEVYSVVQLKTIQEILTLVVFAGFSVWYLRKLPRQADTSKIELPAWVVRYSAGLSPPSESCGRISL